MLSNLVSILNVLQNIAVIVTLAIVAWQTVLLVKQTKLNTIISYHQYFKDIDIAMLQNPKVAQSLLEESEEDEMYDLIIGLIRLTYKLRKAHLTDRSWLITEEASLSYVMKKEFVRRHWEQDKHSYDKAFVHFVDGKLQELDREKQNSSKAP